MEKNDTINKPIVIITNHAYERGKERLSLNKKAIDRLTKKAYLEGIKHVEIKGKARKYIDNIHSQKKTIKQYIANNIRIYGEVVFLFKNNTLITLYQLPNEFKKVIKHFKK